MKRQSQRAHAPRGLHFVAALFLIAQCGVAQAQFLNYFNVKEVTAGPSTAIEVRFDFDFSLHDVESLTSPSGEIFVPDNSSFGNRALGSLIKTFSFLDDAFSFLAGDWQGVYATRPVFGGTHENFEFHIDPISNSSVYRGGVDNLSLQPGDLIRSGQTFLMSWDISDSRASGAYMSIAPQFSSGNSLSTSLISRPNPNGNSLSSGSVGSGNRFFSRERRNVPGTSDYRFLTTYEGAPLPLDLLMTFGTTTLLNSAVDNPNDNDTNPINGTPAIGLRYIWTGNPFEVTLVSIPEPSTLLIAIMGLVVIGTARHRRHDIR